MAKIHIKEQNRESDSSSFTVSVTFDDNDQFDGIIVRDPLTPRDRAKLEWHFERYVELPYLKEVEPREAAAIIKAEGENLFSQIFAGREVNQRYQQAIRDGVATLVIEISGSPDLHRIHWESLKSPDLPRPFVLDALVLRKDTRPQALSAEIHETAAINLLIVTSRPQGRRDVGYRTISRPLVELLRDSLLPVHVHILRPPTFKALSRHLKDAGHGFYQVVHFDVHGALLTFDAFEQIENPRATSDLKFQATRYGRPQVERYDGVDAFLFFDVYREPERDGDDGFRPDPVRADELADLLITHGIPLIILNACQSAKELGGQGRDGALPIVEETSLASRLMRAGAQTVLAMSYSVTVTAAKILMKSLYQELFRGQTLHQAIQIGRQDLANDKQRRASFNQRVSLEDWLLPVVYQKQAIELKTRRLTGPEQEALSLSRQELGGIPEVEYGFHGRDVDILNVERRVLLKNNILLIRGMGGAGKTTLLRHLSWWWQATGFVEKVFYFGYDQKAYSRQEIVFQIAGALYDKFELARFQAQAESAQIEELRVRLRNERHLLIFDNLESIQGEFFAIRNTLSSTEQTKLKEFIEKLRGSTRDFKEQASVEQTLVLLGSRSAEEWLAEGTFSDNLYDLGGLDRESATQFAEEILRGNGALRYKDDENFQKLLKLLAGFPLPLKVILENLKRQTPAEVLSALELGDVNLESGTAREKTANILKCIEYSHSNIAPEKQELLLCLAPFTSIVNRQYFEYFVEELKKQKNLAHLKHGLWDELFTESVQRGLMSQHEVPLVLQMQPILPWFLRTEMQKPERIEFRKGVESAFREYFQGVSGSIRRLMSSKEPDEKQVGQFLASLEFENIETCLRYSLDAQSSIGNPFSLLSDYFDSIQNHEAGLKLAESVLPRIETYSAEILAGRIGLEIVLVLTEIARRQLNLKKFVEAEKSYQKSLEVLSANTNSDASEIRISSASILHQLGIVAEEQREWAKAEGYYQQALAIYVEFNDRYEQADTLHQLGILAQKQREWAKAEGYYQQALTIFVEFNDRYSQASPVHQLGMVAEDQREWAKAEGYYQQALTIYVEFHDRHSQADTLHQLGIVAQEQREWAKAEGYYQQALAIRVEFHDRYSEAGTLHQLGTTAQEQREWAKAGGYYLQSLEIFHEFNDSNALGITLRNLGRLLRESGAEGLLAKIGEVIGMSEEQARELLETAAADAHKPEPEE